MQSGMLRGHTTGTRYEAGRLALELNRQGGSDGPGKTRCLRGTWKAWVADEAAEEGRHVTPETRLT